MLGTMKEIFKLQKMLMLNLLLHLWLLSIRSYDWGADYIIDSPTEKKYYEHVPSVSISKDSLSNKNILIAGAGSGIGRAGKNCC